MSGDDHDCRAADAPRDGEIPLSRGNAREQELLLLEPYAHLVKVSGKGVRKKLLGAFNYWLKVPEEKLGQVGAIVQMLHNASLLIDDIEDRSVLRRGIPVAHKIYGEASTINSANYVMFIGLQRVIDLGHPRAVEIYCEQMLELHRGQGMEIYWRDNFYCPTEEEYRQMTIRKTGGLFHLAVKLLELFSPEEGNNRDTSELLSFIGLYFQVRDDYCNLLSEEYATNKSFAEDLTEGKFNFPIIHAIRSNCGDKVMNIVRRRTTDVEVKKYCIALLEKCGSFDYTRKVLADLECKIRSEIENLGGNSKLVALMDELSDRNAKAVEKAPKTEH